MSACLLTQIIDINLYIFFVDHTFLEGEEPMLEVRRICIQSLGLLLTYSMTFICLPNISFLT